MTTLPSTEQSESPRRQSRRSSPESPSRQPSRSSPESRGGQSRRASFLRGVRNRSLADDRRGVTELLGLILAFTLVVSLVVLLQVSAVPTWNKAVEYEHSQRVQQDFDDFGATTTRVAATGVGETVALERGVDYPSRFVLINPPPASGTLGTSGSGSVSFSNLAFVEDNAQAYWTTAPAADRPDLAVRALTYDPGYNEYRDAGTVVYEGSVQYRTFSSATLVDRVALVDGDRITLVLLEGDLATSGVDPATLDVVPLSAPARTVRVADSQANSDNIVVRVPSELPATDWRTWLEADGELAADGGRVVDVSQDGPGAVRLELAEGEYELRIVKLGLDGGTVERTPRYVAPVSDTSVSVAAGERVTLAVEARDQYNNPVGGVPVAFTGLGPGADRQVETDEQGRAALSFIPPSNGTHTVDADIDYDSGGESYESVRFTVDVGDDRYNALFDPTQSGVDVGKMLNPSAQDVYVYDWAEFRQVSKNDDVVIDVGFENPGGADLEITRARLNFLSNNAPGNSKSGSALDATLTHAGTDYPLGVGEGYLVLAPTIDPKTDSPTVRLTLSDSNAKYTWTEGDFLVLSFEFRDTDTGTNSYGTYFVAPVEK